MHAALPYIKTALNFCAGWALTGIVQVIIKAYLPASKYRIVNDIYKIGAFVLGWILPAMLTQQIREKINSEVDSVMSMFTAAKKQIDETRS